MGSNGPLNFMLSEGFFVGKFLSKNTKFGAKDFFTLKREFKSNNKILSTHRPVSPLEICSCLSEIPNSCFPSFLTHDAVEAHVASLKKNWETAYPRVYAPPVPPTLMTEMTGSDMMSAWRLFMRYSRLFAGSTQTCTV